jgi:excisionase family DNA binding protein
MDGLLTVDEVCQVMNLSRDTVERLEKNGFLTRVQLPKVKVVRFRRSDVATLIRRREAATPIPGSSVKEIYMDDLEVNSLADTQAAAMKRAKEDDQLVALLDEDRKSDATNK